MCKNSQKQLKFTQKQLQSLYVGSEQLQNKWGWLKVAKDGRKLKERW